MILIVDDEPRHLCSYARFLKRYDLRVAASVAEVRAVFAPNIGICDFDLGDDETGIDVLPEVGKRVPTAQRYLVSGNIDAIPAIAADIAHAVIDKLAPEMFDLLRIPATVWCKNVRCRRRLGYGSGAHYPGHGTETAFVLPNHSPSTYYPQIPLKRRLRGPARSRST